VTSPAYRTAIEELISARTAAGMTQRQLAEKLGKPPSFVGKIESRERRVDLIEFVAFTRALGLSEVDLMRLIAQKLPRKIEI
jgi:transcriptional regulator with XRE-family HTH domain